jgi:hypothetical protein
LCDLTSQVSFMAFGALDAISMWRWHRSPGAEIPLPADPSKWPAPDWVLALLPCLLA